MEKNSFEFFRALRSNPRYQNISKPIIVADSLRTPENMGSVLRLAGNIGAGKTIFISEIAQTFKNYKINRTASGAGEKVEWTIIKEISQLQDLIPDDYQIIAIETAEHAQNIFEFKFPEKVVLLLGNEVSGISEELMALAEKSVYIPIPGPVSSLNVTHALSIAAFEWLRQRVQLSSGN
jgi:tRNA G18 (ribose-2'-O)-methylase SpoU